MYRLKEKREAAGMSQSQLAEAAGVTLRNVQAYEAESATTHRNINKAEALTVYRMAQAIGCDISEILEADTNASCM